MKKAYWSLCIILLAITLSACGGKQSPAPDDPIPAENEILDTDNPFLLADFSSAGVFSGSGDIIGTYGYIEVGRDQVPDFYSSDFSRFIAEFVDAKVRNSGRNWITIILDDGTGFCFTGSNSVVANYGMVDEEGGVVKTLGICMLSSETGEFEYTDFCIREIPNPNFLQEALAPENSFKPAPEEIFLTTAEENGYGDQSFYVEGEVTGRLEVSGFDTIQLTTENGDLYVSAVLVDLPDVSIGDNLTVFFVYTGRSIEFDVACAAYVYSE